MSNEKVIFVIPGYKQHSKNIAYKNIAKILKREGYFPLIINIPWKERTISENTDYFLKVYKKIKAKKKYILGFSYGAMIAFVAGTKIKTSGIILCSMSPFFSEDLKRINNKALTTLMIKRYQDFSKLHCGKLAKKLKTKKILMLYGAQETKSLIKRVHYAFGKISSKQKHLIRISQAEHEIGHKRYLTTIHQVTRNLL